VARTIDDTLAGILKQYGADPQKDIWDCHGTWVAYHRTLERIAVQAGITFEPPTIVRSEADECVIAVTGHMDKRQEWSFGEARIGQNYKVSGKQAGYPYAMAEKRAKDRVILKLVGLAGHVYSEEEADDFKPGATGAKSKGQSRDGYARLQRELDDLSKTQADPNAVREWWKANKAEIEALPDDWLDTLTARAETHVADMKMRMAGNGQERQLTPLDAG
jgi:hypothetical protein